jgi:hypothetical protein
MNPLSDANEVIHQDLHLAILADSHSTPNHVRCRSVCCQNLMRDKTAVSSLLTTWAMRTEHSKALRLILKLIDRNVLSLGKLLLSPYAISDFQPIECVAIGLGMKSRLPIGNPGIWLDSGAGWGFQIRQSTPLA